ncbi:hypothetical protein DRJ22_06300, partial [Candidatus Woesearchaeota archaeon]
MKKRNGFFKALTSFIILSLVVVAVSAYFVFDSKLIGPVFLVLGIVSLIFLKIAKINLASVYPDMVFG